jgi:hypothetical protein
MLMPNSGITMGLSYLIGYSGSSLGTTKILEDFMKKDPVSTGKRFNVKYIIFPLNLIGQQINDAVSHGSLIPVMNIPLCNGALFEINQFSPRFYITRTGEIYSGYETSFPDLLDHIKEKPQKYAAVDCSLMMKGGKSLSMDKLVLEKLKNLLHDDMHDQYTSDYSIKLKEYSTDKIFIETFSQEPGLFICEDNYYNGWRVYVDKIESEILKVNGCLRGVILESGNHQIELCYSTQSLKTCFVLYVLFVSGTALGFSVYFLKKFQLV